MDDPARRAPEGLSEPSRVEVVLQDVGRRVQDRLVDFHGAVSLRPEEMERTLVELRRTAHPASAEPR